MVIAALAAGCRDASAPLRPGSVEIAGGGASGEAGIPLAQAPTFVVLDQNGSPLAGVPVTLTVSQGGGTLTNPPPRSTSGPTPIGTWTLGPVVGTNEITLHVDGLSPIPIHATAVAGPPAAIASVGSFPTALAGVKLDPPLRLRVNDAFGNAIVGVPVDLQVIAGGGSLGSPVVTTGADGIAAVADWTLGNRVVAQRIRATAGGISAEFAATVATDFQIEVRVWGDPISPVRLAAFTEAAQRLSAIVVGDLSPVEVVDLNMSCGVTGVPPLTEIIDDLLIFAAIRPIDGPGRILGSAGPCFVRTGGLPVIGVMQFDIADIGLMEQHGIFADVILHEMLHVLGIGNPHFWSPFLQAVGTPQVAYSGPQARQGCLDSGGALTCATSVPVENEGGAGTAGSHWRTSVFQNELMTGFASTGIMPVSRITIGGLADLGYQVNFHARDDYLIPGSAFRRSSAPVLHESWERIQYPLFEITGTGQVTPIPPSPSSEIDGR